VFAELKLLAEPFVDSPESLTARLIHEEVVRRGKESSSGVGNATQDDVRRLNPVSHENLAHTRLISAVIGGREMYRPKWNGLMNELHVLALKHLGSFDALKQASGARLRQGRFEEEGYKYLPAADLSIQGVDANLAWDHSLKLARAIAISIKVEFEWRDKEGAVHPGRRGVLEWSPPEPARVRSPRLARAREAGDFVKKITEIHTNAGL